ncbi:MAG: DUF2974 domain-containing protein [Candidatus Lactobacillus pullistercoris]|uniref:DUF2974 domain-containing protein n=1 Tax=Candidatus Lactobacillus pullistercoris TaxID=2838636 RepID=A0A9E2KQP5_9LACO|nr:DUF2974 domain-containing protein [Candidatus Lactobacillus pullistercoris]
MDINKQLTDQQRVELTKKSYENLTLGQRVTIDNLPIGIMTESVYENDGLRAFVISNSNEITVLFKGSYGIVKGNPTTWHDEWLKTNLPILVALLSDERRIPSQLKSAAKLLNRIILKYTGERIYIYGHSLGSINAQYALANCHHPDFIAGAYLYEGTNIWLLLNQKQRSRVSKMRQKIFNYVDIYDPVTLGITASHRMVGKLCYVDSQQLAPIKQHMWGGYQFDRYGNLKLKQVDAAFLKESLSEFRLLSRSNDLAKLLEKMGQTKEIRRYTNKKLSEWQKNLPDRWGWAKLGEIFKIKDKY